MVAIATVFVVTNLVIVASMFVPDVYREKMMMLAVAANSAINPCVYMARNQKLRIFSVQMLSTNDTIVSRTA